MAMSGLSLTYYHLVLIHGLAAITIYILAGGGQQSSLTSTPQFLFYNIRSVGSLESGLLEFCSSSDY
jgi:hypothetical protein